MSETPLTVSLREYLDMQFSQQRDTLARIEGELRAVSARLDALAADHSELERAVTQLEARVLALEVAENKASDFRRRLLFALIPTALAVVGYLVIQLIQSLSR